MLSVINLNKKFGEKNLFNNLSFVIGQGEKVALIGQSGIGKSTLLKCIAGLEPHEGQVTMLGKKTLVFQDFNLFPHMNVLENITYVPVNVFGKNIDEVTLAATNLLGSFLLQDCVNRYPSELSGGQQQRIAIIRALLSGADLLIMDEPTSSLDNETTALVAQYLKTQPKMLLFATHDTLFVDQVATRILEFTATGELIEIVKAS
jgi:polar amino acid transport system ATP-binding protein